MKALWYSEKAPAKSYINAAGWVRAVLRGAIWVPMAMVGLLLLLLIRVFERPIWGQYRPLTPYITQAVCRITLMILGIRFRVKGELMLKKGAVVANHSTWVDIFSLNARKRIYFVAKSEVANWPFIGWLARATGTVFIRRNARDARKQKEVFEARLKVGHKLLFFPEGTSTDGLRVLRFKSTLFAAFFTQELRDILWIQPVSVSYTVPTGEEPRFYGWWGDMNFTNHVMKVLASKGPGSVVVTYHAPLKVSDFADRKALAKACELAVHLGMPEGTLSE